MSQRRRRPGAPGQTAAKRRGPASQARIRDLTSQRRRIAELAGGERLFLPAEVVGILDDLRALGVSERTVRIERDAWIMMNALSPGVIPQWVAEKAAALADPEFRRIYLACDEAAGWDPADPRLPGLARDMMAWASRQPGREPVSADLPEPVMLMSAYITAAVPAWQRLYELSLELERAAAGDQRSLPNTR